MTPDQVVELITTAFRTGLILSLPIMMATLIVGILISIVQSITSIQEQTMVFVPKILAVFAALLVSFSWMMNTVISYTQELFALIPEIVR